MYYDKFASIVKKRLKEEVFKAQRMYYLSLKLDKRVPKALRKFSMGVLDKYTRIAKEMDLKLTSKELYDRIIDK